MIPESRPKATVLGIDMCRGSWCVMKWDGSSESGPKCEIIPEIRAEYFQDADAAAIDIPIGLPAIVAPGGRAADKEARRFLKGKGSSVFPAPCRAAIFAEDNLEASRINRANSTTGSIAVPAVAFGLFRKLREIDALMTPELQNRCFEAHPELSFAVMNKGRAVLSYKKDKAGQDARRLLLQQSGFPVQNLELPAGSKNWSWDDVLDACACAWTARRILNGASIRLSGKPECDSRGLRMEINA